MLLPFSYKPQFHISHKSGYPRDNNPSVTSSTHRVKSQRVITLLYSTYSLLLKLNFQNSWDNYPEKGCKTFVVR